MTTPRRGRNLRLLIVLPVVLALLVVGGLAWHWWSHPGVFEDEGSNGYGSPSVGSPVYFFPEISPPLDDVSRDAETITLRSAALRFGRGAELASYRLGLCTLRRGRVMSVFPASESRLRSLCTRLVPVRHDVRWRVADDPSVRLLVSMVQVPGRAIRLTGVEVRYSRSASHLGQTGKQLLPQNLVVSAEPVTR